MVPSLAGTSHHAPWPEDALTGSVLRPRFVFASTLRAIATHYDTIGVRSDASPSEIRAAYLERARRLHPDVATGDQRSTSASMAELNRAYQVLRTPASRAQYDRQLRAPTPPSTGSAAGSARRDRQDDDRNLDDWDRDDWEGRDHDHDFGDGGYRRPGARVVGKVLNPSGPARMPWRFMAVAALVGSVAIIASSALVESPTDEAPDGILRVGSCVQVEANSDVREIACGPDAELVVRLVIPTDARCPPAYSPYRDRLGLGTACVEPIADQED